MPDTPNVADCLRNEREAWKALLGATVRGEPTGAKLQLVAARVTTTDEALGARPTWEQVEAAVREVIHSQQAHIKRSPGAGEECQRYGIGVLYDARNALLDRLRALFGRDGA